MEPPPCVQNAMMTKDKKPFTYTPGGIDLSEVRSPRMARRIERNAHLPGSGEGPRPAAHAQQNVDRLPASALAAMRPQPQVQVFPSPPPAMPFKGAVPPPPPPPSQGIPPPPPPPTAPLPTQKVKTGDNQVLERPDMTKIIPDNPMSLLRKTGGPQPRKSLVDEIFAQGDKPQNRYQPNNDRAVPVPPAQAQPQYQQRPQQYQQQPQVEQYRPQSQQYQQQPQVDQYRPQSQQYQQQPQVDQYRPQSQQYQQQPQVDQYRPQQYQQQPQQYQHQPQQYQQQHKSPEAVKEPPRYQPPVIERQPSKTYQEPQPEVKTSTAHLGSLYIPPVDQQKRIVPERNQDSPKMDSPSLREAPKPWQVKKTQQEETPVWAKKENQNTPSPVAAVKEQQQTWPQSRPAQHPVGVRIEIRTKPQPEYHLEADERSPNAVYVTQPLVLQHPGPRMTSQQDQHERRNEQRGERIIPIKIEGATQAERTFQRQQSNPTQSNKFKIIQKFTNTEEDQAETSPVTEHSPKFPQNFQQQVSRGQQQSSNNGPYIRTVPVELEDNEQQQQYVHPSEQVVPEPKKYMGSSIPGRSFRILQAMTAPNNNCANATDQNEAFQYDEWDYTRPYLPYPYPPYWPPPPYPYPPSDNESTPRNTPTPRDPPQPYWHYPHSESDSKTRNAPNPIPRPAFPPFWGYPNENTETCSSCRNTPISWSHQDYDYYPHYFDPYYYYYYYGYPPVYPHYPHYDSETPGEQQDGVKPPDGAPGAADDLEVKVTSPSPLLEEDTEEEYEDELSNDASDENQTDSEADDVDNPHQLSVIMEESERTESRMRSESVLSNTTTIADNSDDEAECSAAKLSLPLKLCVTLTDEPIKQVVVEDGSVKTFDDAEIHASFTLKSPSSTPKKTSPCRFDDDEKIEEAAEAAVVLEEQEVVAAGDDGKESDDSEDWWGIIGKEDDMPVRKKNSSSPPADVVEQSTDPATGGAEKPAPSEEDVGEDSSSHQTSKKSVYESVEEEECDGKLMLVDDFASQFAQIQENFGSWNLKVLKKLDIRKKAPNNAEAEEVEVASSSADYTGYNFSKSTTLFDIQQGMEVTKPYTPVELDSDSSSDESQSCSEEDKQPAEEVKVPTIKERIQALKNSIEEKERKLQENKIEVQVSRSKTTSTKSSIKSLEDFSEEELDSGVTSDMSRHISDSEEFPELRRLSRYQRAATHSRLYKLLQDECEIEEVVEQSFRRDKLSLPLNDKERLIEETVQSFLKHKKAQVFKNVAEDKLRAAAARILGEELELSPSTSSSSFLSPQRNSTGYSTTVPTPQEFNGNHDEYVQYYDSWMNADTRGDYAVGKDSCWGSSQRGGGAKCPRIPSPQNLHQKMIRLLERPDNAS